MITRPILRHLYVALGAHREPEPILADAHAGWMMTPLPTIACVRVAPAPM
jgi:hypothetical protein